MNKTLEATREMKDSGIEWIGKIPTTWGVQKLGSLMEFINGYAFSSSEFSFDGAVPVVRIGDIQNGNINFQSCLRTNNKAYGKSFLMDGDILLAMSGATTGKTAYIPQISDRVATNQRVGNTRSSVGEKKYIYYALNTCVFRQYIDLLSMGTAQPNISTENMKIYKLSVPRLHEQQAIADYLDEQVGKMDGLISEQKQAIEKWKAYKQSLIDETVTKGLNPNVEMKDSGIAWMGAIPKAWGVRRLGHFSKMIVPMRDKPTIFNGDIPWIRIEDFEGKYISRSKSNQNVSLNLVNEMNMKIYPVGTVLCSCSCNLGVSAIVKRELCSNQTFIGIVPNKSLSSEFLYYLMISNSKRLNFLAEGAIQSYMSRQKFEHLKIQIPPFHEQQAIANYLDEKCSKIDQTIEQKELLIQQLEEYKQSLIYECVTGKRRVL